MTIEDEEVVKGYPLKIETGRCRKAYRQEENCMSKGIPLLLLIIFCSCSYSFAIADEIHDASIRGDTVRIQSILRSDPRAVNAKTANGETPLHLAARHGRIEVVRLLIENKADVDMKDKSGETPLHEAAKMNQKEVAGMLIQSGADINARDNNGMTALKLAITIHNREVVELLKSHNASE